MATTTKTPQAPAPIGEELAPVHPVQAAIDAGDIDTINKHGEQVIAWIKTNTAESQKIIAKHRAGFFTVIYDRMIADSEPTI
jgi:hypothetical protein